MDLLFDDIIIQDNGFLPDFGIFPDPYTPSQTDPMLAEAPDHDIPEMKSVQFRMDFEADHFEFTGLEAKDRLGRFGLQHLTEPPSESDPQDQETGIRKKTNETSNAIAGKL